MFRFALAVFLSSVFVGILPVYSQTTDLSTLPSTLEDGTLPALKAIAGGALINSPAFTYLTELSDDIGARVTGTPAAARAVAWGVAKMKAVGLENVHEETWKMSSGWTRISAHAELVTPIRRRLTIDSMGWVGSTPAGGVEAEVVPFNMFDLDGELKNSSRWEGKVLVVVRRGTPPKDFSSLFARLGGFLQAAHRAHAVAIIGGQGGSKPDEMHLTHTGVLGFDVVYDIPVVSMAAEDQSQLERFLDAGREVRIKIDVQNRLTNGPIDAANVVGEIRGAQHPEQVLVVGAHLDSWDLAEGTTDNGVGVACVLAAAEAIANSGYKPKRTIRIVLFTGEEQGSLGSFAYVRLHSAEMANHLGALVLDSGQGPVKGFSLGGRNDLVTAFEQFARTLDAFGTMKVTDNVGRGTDTEAFTIAGLPGIDVSQDSPDYTWHSAADTLEAVKRDVLIQNATIMALTSYWIAGRPERFASPWPADKVARMLVDKHLDGYFTASGRWPFGNLGAEEKSKSPKRQD
jgi:Peptidase family M28